MTSHLPTYSLRKRLLLLLLVGISVLWLAVAASGFLRAHHEADEIFDAQLVEVALTLLAVGHVDQTTVAPEITDHLHKYQQRILFQVWRLEEGKPPQLVVRSANAPHTPLPGTDGLSEQTWNGELWRFLIRTDDDRDYQVQVAQAHAVRDELAEEIAWRLLVPMLLALPFLGAAVWWAVGVALRPLDAVVDEVQRRQPQRLEPLALPAPLPTEVVPLLDALNQLFARVRTAIDNERRFTADAAHELRTPLAALKVQAQVAQRAAGEPQQQAIRQVLGGVERMTHLVEQLLTLARVDPDNPTLQAEVVDLRVAAAQACADLMPVALARGQTLEVDDGEGRSPAVLVLAHPALLLTLLRNLIDNACRYTPAGGRIVLRLQAGEDELSGSVAVVDNGPGIAAADRGAAVQRFHRLHRSAADSSGSGLGLSIVLRIAELHGASLRLEDTPGGGLTAVVSFQPATA